MSDLSPARSIDILPKTCFFGVNMWHLATAHAQTLHSGWAYNRVKLPLCNNFEAKEGMGVYSRCPYFHEGCGIHVNALGMFHSTSGRSRNARGATAPPPCCLRPWDSHAILLRL